jgi:hypothetical protein
MATVLLSLILLIVAACGNLPTQNPNQIEKKGPGSILTGKDTQGISLLDIGNNDKSSAALPINALLWRASLDIASSIPLDDVDTFGGTIVTEWYQLDAADEERIKLAIFVLDRELRSDGIRVVVYVQKKQDGVWSDHGTDTEMGLQLEELILTRAREIRAATVSETQ